MSIQDLVNISEILAALGVVISLIFVGFQIRQNTKAIKRQEANVTLDQWSRVRSLALENDGLADILVRSLSGPDSLTEVESLQYALLMTEFFNCLALLHRRVKEGLIEAREWAVMRDSTRQILESQRGNQVWLTLRPGFSEGFVREIENT